MFLLDTHIWLWWVNQNLEKIPRKYIEILENKPSIFISSISSLEATILFKKSKVELTGSFKDWYISATEKSNIKVIDYDLKILEKFLTIPALHKDSMDRLIIATAIEQKLQLLSLDGEFPKYKDFGLELV